MKKLNKGKKILLCGLTSVASIGAISAIAVPLSTTQKQHVQNSINSSTENKNEIIPGLEIGNQTPAVETPVIETPAVETPVIETPAVETPSIETPVQSDKLSVSLFRTLTRGADAEATYTMEIKNNEQKEGTIYLVKDNSELVNSITFKPGDTITFFFAPNKGYENYTVRDFKISGVKENHYVPTKNHETDKRVFTAKMPTIEESTDKMTGENWLYGDGAITVNPSFIIADIGENGTTVEWTHGAFFESINGYVYSFTKDMKWSEIEQSYLAFENKDTSNPINLYFFLNGFTLTMDKNLSEEDAEKLAPNGWNLLFYNNNTDSDTNGKYGSIVVDKTKKDGEAGIFNFKGILTMGRSVNHRMVFQGNGVRFLNMVEIPGLVGDHGAYPSKKETLNNWWW